MKEYEASPLIGTVVRARIGGSVYLGVLERIVSRRAWRGIVRVRALDKVAHDPGEIAAPNSVVSVYGGDLGRYDGVVPEYCASIEDACFVRITPLSDVPVPPKLEAALAVDDLAGDQIGIWWDVCYQTVRCFDGHLEGDGSLLGWLSYVQHDRVAPFLEPYALGQAGERASHCLMLDRAVGKMAVAPIGVARLYLRNRAGEPVTAPGRLDRAAIFELARACPELTECDIPGADAVLREYRESAGELWEWLEA